jgi:hypothetical protein
MSNSQQKSIRQKLNYHQDKGVYKKNILGGSIIATIIAATPLLFNLYQGVPDVEVWDTFLFTYKSGWYESVAISFWSLTTSIIPLMLLLIWFFTNKHWWYHALLVPIAMYIYQIIEILDGDMKFTDVNLIIYLLPIMAIIVPSIYLVKAKMFNKINDAGKSMEELEEEFKIKPKSFIKKLGDYF